MRDNIMYYPAMVLMVVEVAALVFLIHAFRKAKKETTPPKQEEARQYPQNTEIEFDYAAEDD